MVNFSCFRDREKSEDNYVGVFHSKDNLGCACRSGLGLIVLKIIVGLITGGTSVFAQAMYTILDLLLVRLSLLLSTLPSILLMGSTLFGHGEVEDLADMLQVVLIFIAAAVLFGLLLIFA